MITGRMYLKGMGTIEEKKDFLKHCEEYLNTTYDGLKEWNLNLADELKELYNYCLNMREGRE
tara:strand:- start:688 stop:873 length:186 start_codon:yes stop_codon:yes gene_type:complete